MTAKTMAEVLAAHWSVSTHADNEPEPPVDKCDGCGKVLHTWGDQIPEVHPLAAHQAAALSAAGFGLVADAKAEGARAAIAYLREGMEAWAEPRVLGFLEGAHSVAAHIVEDS